MAVAVLADMMHVRSHGDVSTEDWSEHPREHGSPGKETMLEELEAIPSAPPAGQVVQCKGGKDKLNPKQEEQQKKLQERAERRAREDQERRAREAKIKGAEAEFYTAVGAPTPDHIPPHSFPFDFNSCVDDNGQPVDSLSIGQAVNRLPAPMRRSEFCDLAAIGNADHNQGAKRTEVKKGELQETMTAWQFSREKGIPLSSLESGGQSIDFKGTDKDGSDVLFDPFMSPMGGPARAPSEEDQEKWARNDRGAYQKHTHGKGGNDATIGVWDKTYTPPPLEQSLKQKLHASGADQDANVHEVRIPLANMYAAEHVTAETQIEKQHRELAEAKEFLEELREQFNATQRGKPANQRKTFNEILIDEDEENGGYSKEARKWRAKMAAHPYWATRMGD